MILRLRGIKPTPLNRLYTPIVRGGRPSIILSKQARESKKLVQMEVLRQKQNKILKGSLSFKMDVIVSKVKSPDIDGLLKMLLDSFEGLCYTNDKQINELIVRKHLNQGYDEIVISVEKLDNNQ